MLAIHRGLLCLAVALPFCTTVAGAQANASDGARNFLIDPGRPFVYVKFDHIGPGGKDQEPISRMWLRLVNNCQLPIAIRTSGTAKNHLKGEIGVMDRVVADSESGVRVLATDAAGKAMESPTPDQGAMPIGYESDVSSTESIPPGGAAFFSVPVNHVSEKWHLEIPFEFDLPRGKGPGDPVVGGFPSMLVEYNLWDLPPERRSEVEHLIQQARARH